MTKFFKTALWSFITLLIIAIIVFSSYTFPLFKHFPKPTGPYAVGRVMYDVTDQNRLETYGTNPNQPRKIPITIWYPTNIPTEKAPQYSAHLSAQMKAIKKRLKETIHLPLCVSDFFLRTQNTYAISNAPRSDKQSSYPVIIFSPALGLFCDLYTVILEELASHGYIVVGVDHTYLSNITIFTDGSVAWMDDPSIRTPELCDGRATQDEMQKEQMNINRSQTYMADMQSALAYISHLYNEHRSPFYHALDLNHIGIIGHSIGAKTGLEVCRIDDRCKVFIDIDGWSGASLEGFNTPSLFMVGKLPDISQQDLKESGLTQKQFDSFIQEHERKAQVLLSSHGAYLKLDTLNHRGFSDLMFLRWPWNVIADIGNVNPNQTLALINETMIAFLQQNL